MGGYAFVLPPLLLPILADPSRAVYSTAQATVNAYLSDCTSSGSRARVFSILGGIMFGGLALGPVFGSFLIRQTGSVLAPFYGALVMHLLYVLVAGFIFPESLSKTRQYAARARHAEDKKKLAEAVAEEDVQAKERGMGAVLLVKGLRLAARPWGFLAPLKLMLPRKRSSDELEEDKPGLDAKGEMKGGWDFSLVKIAIAMGAYGVCMVSRSLSCSQRSLTPVRRGQLRPSSSSSSSTPPTHSTGARPRMHTFSPTYPSAASSSSWSSCPSSSSSSTVKRRSLPLHDRRRRIRRATPRRCRRLWSRRSGTSRPSG